MIVTPGEPAGSGLDVCLLAALGDLPSDLVVLCDRDQLSRRAAELGIGDAITLLEAPQGRGVGGGGVLRVLHRPQPISVAPGRPATANAPYLLACLDEAVALVADGQSRALVTGPLDKAVINDAGIPFTGHTEYIAAALGVPLPVMMLVGDGLRVALVTTHLPLREVPAAITPGRLEETLRTVAGDLRRRFRLSSPRLRVCGLNPHAGEKGYLGKEELAIIIPTLERLRSEGFALDGPVPGDTAFLPADLARSDAVVAMYHDQGLAVLKHRSFEVAVNVTLGLPIVRTSVDHGTAYALAGNGTVNPGSFVAAVKLADELAA